MGGETMLASKSSGPARDDATRARQFGGARQKRNATATEWLDGITSSDNRPGQACDALREDKKGADYTSVALSASAAPRQQSLVECARAEDEGEVVDGAAAPDLTEDPKENDELDVSESEHAELAPVSAQVPLASMTREGPTPGPVNIATVLRPGEQPRTFAADRIARSLDKEHAQTVDPGGKPTETATKNSCVPSTASATLAWDVAEADKDNWAADVQSLTLAGVVNVKPWPSKPTTMTVPNTPNPVDGGNINDTAGSDNHWKAAIADMADYNLPNGGAGPNWHSTDASHAHEWAHWDTDYVIDSVGSAAGGNWPKINGDIDALRQPKATSATAAAAKTALTGRVNALFGKWRSDTIKRWNAIPDTAGVAGSTGYIAGEAVLKGLIDAVQAYADTKGWSKPPPLPPPPRPGRDPPP